VIRYINNQ